MSAETSSASLEHKKDGVFEGGCHCGNVRWRLTVKADEYKAIICK